MKYKKRLPALLLALTLLFTSPAPLTGAAAEGTLPKISLSLYKGPKKEKTVVYVSSVTGTAAASGLTPETPLNSITNAMKKLGKEGGKIVIVDELSLKAGAAWYASEADGMKRVIITGYNTGAVLHWDTSLSPNGPLTLEYLNISVDASWAYLNARGHDVVFGKGLVMTKGPESTTFMCVRGGGDRYAVAGDTHVTIYSGTFGHVCGGSARARVSGDSYITVYGGSLSSLYGGNNNYTVAGTPIPEDANVAGDSHITIYGGTVTGTCAGGDGEVDVEGTSILDISRYPNARSAWFDNFDEVIGYDPSLPEIGLTRNVKPILRDSFGIFMTGYPDGSFRPLQNVTRGEAIHIISSLVANIGDTDFSEITDVTRSHPYYNDILKLESLGMLPGLIDRFGALGADEPLTRKELCLLLAPLAGERDYIVAQHEDIDASMDLESISILTSEKILPGCTETNVYPYGCVTRADLCEAICRLIGREPERYVCDYVTFNDIEESSAKWYIIAAANEKYTPSGEVVWDNAYREEFSLSPSASTSADYISELYAAASRLSAEAIEDGAEAIAERRVEEILDTTSDISVTGTTYYVSASGNDGNDGRSPNSPWHTLSKVSAMASSLRPGDAVLFKRGDTFRCTQEPSTVKTAAGVTYGAYGTGPKPNLYGCKKNYADPSYWAATDEPNVWKLTEPSGYDVGSIVFDGTIPARKIIRSDESNGTHLDYHKRGIFNDYHDLTDDLSFFHWSRTINNSTTLYSDGNNYLYLRCEAGNPGSVYSEIELSRNGHLFTVGSNKDVRFDNLCIAYVGSHGISAGSCNGLTVTNCEIKWIGGTVQTQIGSSGRTWPTPFGNGIEIYGEAKNYTVENCYVHQCYDAGVTHQYGSNATKVENDNVNYRNNVISNCVYAIEIFYGEPTSGTRLNAGTHIENNILMHGGGFGHDQRPDTGVTALIRNGGICMNTVDYIVRNNIFLLSRERLISANADGGSLAEYYNNLYVQKRNSPFCTRSGTGFNANANIAASLVNLGTEHDGVFVIRWGDLGYEGE